MRKSFSDGRFIRRTSLDQRGKPLPPGYFWRVHATPVRYVADRRNRFKRGLGVNGKTGLAPQVKKYLYARSIYPDYRDRWLADYAAWLIGQGWTVTGICQVYRAVWRRITILSDWRKAKTRKKWRARFVKWRRIDEKNDGTVPWPQVADWNCCRWSWRKQKWIPIKAPALTKLLEARAAGWPLLDGKPIEALAQEIAATIPESKFAKPRKAPIPCAPEIFKELTVGAPKNWLNFGTWPMFRIDDLGLPPR